MILKQQKNKINKVAIIKTLHWAITNTLERNEKLNNKEI